MPGGPENDGAKMATQASKGEKITRVSRSEQFGTVLNENNRAGWGIQREKGTGTDRKNEDKPRIVERKVNR